MKKSCEIKLPPNVKFSDDHQWVSASAPYRIGISDYAQDELGPLIFAELPQVGTVLTKGQEYGSVESDNKNCPLASPVAGKVVAVNDALTNDPTLVNSDPYGAGWIIEVELVDDYQLNCLISAADYKKKVDSGACGEFCG